MPDDTHPDESDAHAPHDRDEIFEPIHTDDRFRRRVRDDHAPNAALHSALRAVTKDDDRAWVNLMASHAPGERPHEPRYHVGLTLENAGAGEPSTGDTVIDDMIDRDDVAITKAYGGTRYDGVDAVDQITVHLRPVETRVEPVEVRYADIPDRFVDVVDVEHDATRTLRLVVDEHGPDSDRANAAAHALATVVYTADPDRWEDRVDTADAAPNAAHRELWRRAGVDPDSKECGSIRPTVDGFAFEGPEDERTAEVVEAIRDPDGRVVDGEPITHGDIDDVKDAIDAAWHSLHGDPYAGFPYDERGTHPPTGRPPVEPIREWVIEHKDALIDADIEGETCTDIAEQIADRIETYEPDPDDAPESDEDGFIPDGATDEDVREGVEDVETDSKPGTVTRRRSWESWEPHE